MILPEYIFVYTFSASFTSWNWGENLLFCKIFDENCMKMKEIEPKGASLASP